MWSNLKWKLVVAVILVANNVQPSQRNRQERLPTIRTVIKEPPRAVLAIPAQRTEIRRVVTPVVVVTPITRIVASPVPWGWLRVVLMILLVAIGVFLLLKLNLFNSQKSPYFNVIFENLSQADQNTVNLFKQGPHSWILNSTHSGVIISDVILNSQLVGLRLIFDNQQNIYLTYYELLNLYKIGATFNIVNLSIPDRSLNQNNIIDSNVNSYQITFTANLNLFNFQYMASKGTCALTYQNGIVTNIVNAYVLYS